MGDGIPFAVSTEEETAYIALSGAVNTIHGKEIGFLIVREGGVTDDEMWSTRVWAFSDFTTETMVTIALNNYVENQDRKLLDLAESMECLPEDVPDQNIDTSEVWPVGDTLIDNFHHLEKMGSQSCAFLSRKAMQVRQAARTFVSLLRALFDVHMVYRHGPMANIKLRFYNFWYTSKGQQGQKLGHRDLWQTSN